MDWINDLPPTSARKLIRRLECGWPPKFWPFKDKQKYFLLLSDGMVIVGGEFSIMKRWKMIPTSTRPKIIDMLPTKKGRHDRWDMMSYYEFIGV